MCRFFCHLLPDRFFRHENFFLACTLVATGFTSPTVGPWFSGKIVYHNTYKLLSGEIISDKSPPFGRDNFYYISNDGYKLYNERRMMKLYSAATNQYWFFLSETNGPSDAAVGVPGAVIKPLAQTATIAGYPCQSLEITNEEEGAKTVYFYAPKLRVNPERFAKHAMGDFYTYLKATNGALPLRMVVTNTKQGFSMTSEATAVQAMPLTAADFTVDAPVR